MALCSLSTFLHWHQKLGHYKNVLRYTLYVKWLGRCPNCKSDRLHIIEGSLAFKKWFCTDCCSMSYVFTCPHCQQPVLQWLRWKNHIWKEYRLGKYKDDDTFYNACQREYFQELIKFHVAATKEWRQRYDVWKSRRRKSVMYARG